MRGRRTVAARAAVLTAVAASRPAVVEMDSVAYAHQTERGADAAGGVAR